MFFRFIVIVFVLLSAVSYGYAYSDYDVDGVEDSMDACPNTPFDLTVDENGCEEGRRYKGVLSIFAGTISSINKETDNLTNFLLTVNYQYHDFDISVSTLNDVTNTIENVPNTYYISSGYTFKLSDKVTSKLSLGTKRSSIQNDYYITSNIDYNVNDSQDIFGLYTYTVAQDSDVQKYDNFSAFSLGTGKVLTEYWYSTISYDFSQSNIANAENYQALSWSNLFALSSKYFILSQYSYGLSDGASDHTLSVQFGIKFE
jgi:hypothetical protein